MAWVDIFQNLHQIERRSHLHVHAGFVQSHREHHTLALPQGTEPLREDIDKVDDTFPGLLCQGQPWF